MCVILDFMCNAKSTVEAHRKPEILSPVSSWIQLLAEATKSSTVRKHGLESTLNPMALVDLELSDHLQEKEVSSKKLNETPHPV